jgi:uncharacterized membrane protein YfcA
MLAAGRGRALCQRCVLLRSKTAHAAGTAAAVAKASLRRKNKAISVPIGFVGGFFSSSIGVGGAVILTPAIRKYLKLPQHVAQATTMVRPVTSNVARFLLIGCCPSLLQTTLATASVAGALAFSNAECVDLPIAGLLAFPAMIASHFGAKRAKSFSEIQLKVGFASLLVCLIPAVVFSSVRKKRQKDAANVAADTSKVCQTCLAGAI